MKLTGEQVAAARELMTTVARAGHCPVRGVGLACRDCWDAVQDAMKDLLPAHRHPPRPLPRQAALGVRGI